jgi:hypothetical protein
MNTTVKELREVLASQTVKTHRHSFSEEKKLLKNIYKNMHYPTNLWSMVVDSSSNTYSYLN